MASWLVAKIPGGEMTGKRFSDMKVFSYSRILERALR